MAILRSPLSEESVPLLFYMFCALSEYTVVHRSYQGTGVDYFLGHRDDFLFQHSACLEVSGIGNGSETEIRRRKKIKLEQTQRSDALQIPAIVVIVEFSRPMAEVAQREARIDASNRS